MGKIRRIQIKHKKHRLSPGISPGSVSFSDEAVKPEIIAYAYNQSDLHESRIGQFSELDEHFEKYAGYTHWVDVRGTGDIALFDYLRDRFKIHKLVLEDIANIHQRPKVDEYDDYLFAVSRMLYVNSDLEIENEQISFILMPEILFSFQESQTDNIAPVIHRLKGGKGNIRTGGGSYMLYSLMDITVDNYFELIYRLGDELETIEELLYRKADKTLMHQIQTIKRAMIMIRRAAWPERDKINDMIRSDSPLIPASTKPYLKDTYDHSMQVMDLVESYKDVTTSLIDLNISFISNRMNEIMKILTIITSLFIPLTFIAGVYGMNFARQDPYTGKLLPNNMPELYSENGYVYTLLVMLIIAILQVIYFWQKGWLNSR